MRIQLSTLLFCGALLYMGCGSSSNTIPTEEPPKQYQLDIEAQGDSSYRDQKVVVEGYLRLPFSMFYVDKAPLELYPRPNQREGKFLNVELSVQDSSSGIVKLPSGYTAQDLKILTESGDTLMGTSRVRLCGYLRWRQPGEDQTGPVVVLEVDSVFPGREAPATYPSLASEKLDSNKVSDHKRRNYLANAEGMLEIPSMMFAFKEYWLYLTGDFGKVAVNFVSGECPNCLGNLPEKYTEEDFKVYGNDGKLIDLKKPVRVIGNYTGPDSLTTGDLSVEYLEQIND